MNKILFAALITILLFSCTTANIVDDDPLIISLGDEFIGNWTVMENVTNQSDSFIADNTFEAPTIKIDDSTFACIQTHRVPDPDWVLSDPFSADTVYFIPLINSGILKNNLQGEIGTFSENKDTLQFSYYFGNSTTLYKVKQTWVRIN